STDYLIDLVTRFINWQMIGAIFVLFVAWLFLSQWIRITVFVVAILLWLNVLTLAGPSFSLWPAGQPTTTVTTTGGNAAATVAATGGAPIVGDMPAQTAPPTTAN
ncbi:cellulose biosynthesis protein BcsG, partial [Pseudomonas aeruginosa]